MLSRNDVAPDIAHRVAASDIKEMDVSVIIPTFRRPMQLRETLASVLNQQGVELEVIVVDDSPEGSAREVIEKFRDSRIAYLKNPLPTGGFPSVVRNLGWPLSRGRVIHFLDDDDIVPDHHYASSKAAFANHPDVGVVFGRIEPFGEASSSQLAAESRYFADAARRAASCNKFGPKWGFTARMMFDKAMFVCSAALVPTGVCGGTGRLRSFDSAARGCRFLRAYYQ